MAETKKTRKPSQNSKKKPGRPKKQPEPQYDEGAEIIRAEVFIISSFVVAVLLFLSNFNLCGAVGQFLKSASWDCLEASDTWFRFSYLLEPVLLFPTREMYGQR